MASDARAARGPDMGGIRPRRRFPRPCLPRAAVGMAPARHRPRPAGKGVLAGSGAGAGDVRGDEVVRTAGGRGALVFGWRRLDAAPGVKGGAAVSLLAVNEAGERVPWFGARAVAVHTIGSCTGAVFEAHTGESNDPVHVAERESDALALASRPRYGPGRVLAAGSGLRAPAHRRGPERRGGRCRGARGRRQGRPVRSDQDRPCAHRALPPRRESGSDACGRGRGAGRHPRRLRRTDRRGGRTARLDGVRRNARRGSRSVTASDGQGRGVPGVAARLWAAATCVDATLARVYLDRRGCWSGRHVPGAPALPESVRWLARADASASNPAAGWHGFPPGAAGAVVLAWWPARRASTNPVPVAVSRAEPPADTTEAERAHERTGAGGGFRR